MQPAMSASTRHKFEQRFRNRDAPCPWPHKAWHPADMLDRSPLNLDVGTRMLRVSLVREVCHWVKTAPENLKKVYVDFERKKPHDIIGYFPYQPKSKIPITFKKDHMKPILKLTLWEWANMRVKK